jgi:hypothetical protein
MGQGGTEPAGDYTFFCANGKADYHLGTGFVVLRRIISAVKRVEFVSDSMSYIILKRSIPKVPHENSVRRFQCKGGEEDIFKPTIGNESFHETSNDNGVRVVNFAT